MDGDGESSSTSDRRAKHVRRSRAGSAAKQVRASRPEPAREADLSGEATNCIRILRTSRAHPAPRTPPAPTPPNAKHRAVERGAEITLGTEPGEVGKAAGKVLGTVHQYDGIVLDSSVRGGSEGEARARFTLLIPSAKLADALAAFSGIAEVRTRHETSNDITAPTVTTGERLTGLPRPRREPAEPARRGRNRSRAGGGRSEAASRAPPPGAAQVAARRRCGAAPTSRASR